jgi:hypothetical protein
MRCIYAPIQINGCLVVGKITRNFWMVQWIQVSILTVTNNREVRSDLRDKDFARPNNYGFRLYLPRLMC